MHGLSLLLVPLSVELRSLESTHSVECVPVIVVIQFGVCVVRSASHDTESLIPYLKEK